MTVKMMVKKAVNHVLEINKECAKGATYSPSFSRFRSFLLRLRLGLPPQTFDCWGSPKPQSVNQWEGLGLLANSPDFVSW
jgi:hypothetical protein